MHWKVQPAVEKHHRKVAAGQHLKAAEHLNRCLRASRVLSSRLE